MKQEEMLEDIKRMLILISAFTPPNTEGALYLDELKLKYKKFI